MVYNSTSTCLSESGSKFALQVSTKFKLRPGLYSEKDAATWAASSLPEINGSGLCRTKRQISRLDKAWTVDTHQKDL